MKKLVLSLLLAFSFSVFAQVPQGISYQAIALTSSGTPVVSSNVGTRLSVLNGSATGTVLYSETQVKTTNAQGLYNLVIGQGTPVSGTFSSIDWSNGSKFLKVELDVSGGSSYTLVGTTQLLSVPYAFHAGSVAVGSLAGMGTDAFRTGSLALADGNSVKVFYNGAWYSQNCTDYVNSDEVTGSGGNFVVADGNTARVFYKGVWSSQDVGDYINSNEIFTSSGDFVVIGGNVVKGFHEGVWSSQNFDEYVDTTDVTESSGAFLIADGNKVRAFYNGVWSVQTFTDYVSPSDIVGVAGVFVVVNSNTVKGFYKGNWSTQALSNSLNSGDVIPSEKN